MTRRALAIAAAAVIFAGGWLGGTLTAQPVRKYFAATTAADATRQARTVFLVMMFSPLLG